MKTIALAQVLVTLAVAVPASAAPAWVERNITLPRHDVAFDIGLGIGHVPNPSRVGPGMNLELGIGITHRLEIGFRTGLRFGNDGRATAADHYGRLFDTETYGDRLGAVANPEFRIRGAVVSGDVAEIALEGRAYLPFEDGSRFGVMFGVPLMFHVGNSVRLDTGLFVPVLFYDPTATVVSFPFQAWFQVSEKLWLGPMTGVRMSSGPAYAPFFPGDRTQVLLGFGLGYQIARFLDWKSEFLFPAINESGGAQVFGFGTGLALRIE